MVSQRFAQAVASEKARLLRKREGLEKRRRPIVERLNGLEEQIASVRQAEAEVGALPAAATRLPTHDDLKLRGRRIADVAVRVLVSVHGEAPIHYRDWLGLVEAHGYTVAGLRPDSVFHNQVRRHPEVRRSTKAGVFYLLPAASLKSTSQRAA